MFKQWWFGFWHCFCIKHGRDYVSNLGGSFYCPECDEEWHQRRIAKHERKVGKYRLAALSPAGEE